MTDDSNTSYIDFGSPNTSVFTESVAYVPIILDDEVNWTVAVNGFRWGESMRDWKREYRISASSTSSNYGALNLNLPCISGPSKYIEPIKNMMMLKLRKKTRSQSTSLSFDCKDASKLPSFEILV